MNNILILYKSDYPWEVRISKFVKTLTRQNNVVLLARNKNNNLAYETIEKNLTIYRLPIGLHKFLSLAFPLNPFWLAKIKFIIKKENINIIIVRDLPLLLNAIIISKTYKIPLILDMAENYPAAMKAYERPIARNHLIAKAYEKLLVDYAHKIIVVVHEQKQRLIKMGIIENKIVIIENYPYLSEIRNYELSNDLLNNYKDNFVLSYFGNFGPHRGLDTAVSSIVKLKDAIKNIKLLLIGDGRIKGRLMTLVKELGIENYVEFCGYVEHELITTYMELSDICLIPHKKTLVPRLCLGMQSWRLCLLHRRGTKLVFIV